MVNKGYALVAAGVVWLLAAQSYVAAILVMNGDLFEAVLFSLVLTVLGIGAVVWGGRLV